MIGSFVNFQTGNWIPKTNLSGKKKTNFARALNLAEQRFGAPTKTNLARTIWRPDKTTSLYYEVSVGFVPRNWYGTDGQAHGRRDGGRDRETETQVKDLLASGVPPTRG